MTLILKLDLDIAQMYHHTKNEASMSIASKVIARTDRQAHTQTHRHDENITSTTKVIAQTERHTHEQIHRHDENITSTAYAGGKDESLTLECLGD